MRYKTQKTWESIGIAILVAVLVFALASLLMNVFNKNDDEFKKAHLTWSVGGLDSGGKYDKTETDSLTSDPEKINEGIRVVVDFDKSVQYSVAFYDESHGFVGYISGTVTNSNINLTRAQIDAIGEGYEDAVYFRVSLVDIEEDDGYITWFEKQKLKNYITVYTCSEPVKAEATTAADEE